MFLNRSLKKIIFGEHYDPVTMDTAMDELDFSEQVLGPAGGKMVCAFLSKCQ
jgi:hypothetical protein